MTRAGRGIVGRRVTIKGMKGRLAGEWVIDAVFAYSYMLARPVNSHIKTDVDFDQVKFVRGNYVINT